MTEATAVKARILWLDFNSVKECPIDYSVEKYLRIKIEYGGYDIRAYGSLDKMPTAIKEQIEEFDLIIAEPLNTMITEESKVFYESLRDQFIELPPLSKDIFLRGLGTIHALKCLAPSVPLMIYTNITENTKVGRQALEELREIEDIAQIIEKPLFYKEFLMEIEKAIGGKTQKK